ncbi:hypothetical protein Bpfe_027090 [Biomphalaria pfeifferi]|uniref:Uncharacterized protein n=1 Tax=Biomphalaria pfeifferi TaxID=112525 RepID=A0AAD8AW98_BIOPF|nr:hypothetical protein Bpfe_027090 [Biomphalaria pfeifferi]
MGPAEIWYRQRPGTYSPTETWDLLQAMTWDLQTNRGLGPAETRNLMRPGKLHKPVTYRDLDPADTWDLQRPGEST